MDIREYYKFPEDANVSLRYTSFYDNKSDNFPCPADMSNAFSYQSRTCVKMLDTSNVTNMSNMFYYCNNLTTIPLLNTSNVTNMSNMFSYCNKLTSIPQIDTSKCVTMNNMFYSCSILTTIPQIDTSKCVTMESMFYSCSILSSIPQIDTSKCTNMSNMFSYCINLTSIPQIDTSKCTNMNNMFSYCNKLKSLPPINCSSIGNSYEPYPLMAYDEKTYKNLTDVGGFIDMKKSWDGGYGLNKCPNLTYESCINILNGLYDFTGNGETPNSSQGKLKVNSAFIDKVGEQISIATSKGWVVTT